ncbi:hypothetical protein ACIBHX_46670 [Nonomuraea sp. NPDC050536]|uniref:hypothetical protein n=1 Tax=Nonomuraea sp. NPDC050536 TaxID=3364366 RepID=UPI0037C64DEF
MAGEKKSFSDLLGDEDEETPEQDQTPDSETARRPAEAPETGEAYRGTQKGGNGREREPEGRTDSEWPFEDDGPETSRPQNRGKTGSSRVARGTARGRSRRTASAELPKSERDDWRWRLRSLAGKLAADEKALQETEQRWETLVTQARTAGVPDTMLLVALMDAGVEEPDSYM